MKLNRNQNEIDDLMLEAIEVQNTTSSSKKGASSNNKRTRRSSRPRLDSSTDGSDDADVYNIKSGSFLSSRCVCCSILFLVFSGATFGILFAMGILQNDDFASIPILGDVDFEGFFDTGEYQYYEDVSDDNDRIYG